MPKPKRPSRFRLDPAVRPTDYALRLEPSLEAGTFSGEVRIALQIARPRAEITLHAADLAITRATMTTNGASSAVRVKRRPADEANSATVDLPPRAGRRAAGGFAGAHAGIDGDPHVARAGQGSSDRIRSGGRGAIALPARRVLRHRLSVRQARPRRRPRLRSGGDG